MSESNSILSTPIEFLKGIGPLRADMLKKELQLFFFKDLLDLFPYRHIDKTEVKQIAAITPQTDYIQVAGVLFDLQMQGEKRGKRLTAQLKDATGSIELTWFQGITWVQKALVPGQRYLVFGKPGFFMGKPQIVHPEIELFNETTKEGKPFLEPVYPSTEKLKARGLNGRMIAKFSFELFNKIRTSDIPENLPDKLLKELNLMGRYQAYRNAHFPTDIKAFQEAIRRLKFEEFYLAQIRLFLIKSVRHRFSKGVIFKKVGHHFNDFYKNHLPFTLTGAQKRVLKEIREDTGKGRQMNRLLQGDVGSGKTMVALLSMLLACDNGFQSCLMAPTEILARQHYEGISELLQAMPLRVEILTGSMKRSQKKKVLSALAAGEVNILIGTHALVEDTVVFKNLGLAIIDEQHRFGVEQRSKLWKKAPTPPHVLVMTATPIPRTLAMTAYGDLDYSVMDELPPGRQPIATVHRFEDARPRVMQFIRAEIDKGRQVYIIFPLIEESDTLDYENLMKGYENVKAWFPEPKFWISMVHGKQPSDQKETNMQRFVNNQTQIMVSTTVIEVGVNVPNATVMVVESAEKFGLSQLHQLRGRVGRGAEKSFCILLTGPKLSNDGRERLKIMCSTNDGFEIAEKDLELRGPGDIEGTRQSGALNFKLADILNDKPILELAKIAAENTITEDPDLSSVDHLRIKAYLMSLKGNTEWSKIS